MNFSIKRSLWVITLLTLTSLSQSTFGQNSASPYVPDEDTIIAKRLSEWQDLKFGLLMHWGTYSQWGIVESWSLCAEDEDWCKRSMDNYDDYKRAYENLKTTFNPVRFDPSKWAAAAKKAGMKYVVFTTKHHDGFCMYDTKYTDYKVTSESCPFHVNAKSNIAKEVFNAFRKEGLWAGAYFSKPDWNSDYFWWRNFATPDRHANYDLKKYPERWNKFIEFTHNQLTELVSDYGPLDLVWLDGGWVRKMSKEEITKENSDTSLRYQRSKSQDIHMGDLKRKLRAIKPDLIVVDRAVYGPNQNYLTPENTVPEQYLPYPWESCIIAGGSWSWIPDAKYLTSRKVIHTLADVVAKGGNLLLNIAPGPDGTWDEEAYKMLEGVGAWMDTNGKAIYNTRAVKPYKEGKFAWTEDKEKNRYAIYLAEESETNLPEKLMLYEFFAKEGDIITFLGDDTPLEFISFGDGTVVKIPAQLSGFRSGTEAWVLKITSAK